MTFARDQTLTELEGEDWGPPTFGSHLVTSIHQLRYKPLEQFTIADLQVCIGQNVSLEFLLPIALEHLQEGPFAEGDYYRGDLLNAVLKIKPSFWSDHRGPRGIVAQIAQRAAARRRELDAIEVEALEIGLAVFGLSASLDQRTKGPRIFAVLFTTVKLLLAVVAVPLLFISTIGIISILTTEGSSKYGTLVALIVLVGAAGLAYHFWQRQVVPDRADGNESPSRSFSSAYWPATKTALLQQGVVFLLSALTLDMGQTFCEAATAIEAYWLVFGTIVVRRPRSPTRGDMFLIRYGFLLMFCIAVATLPFVGRELGRW